MTVMDAVTLQKQIRDNTEELQNYLKDLSLWNKEMKRKETELDNNPSHSKEIPPIRSKRKKQKKTQENNSKEINERISALDYSSWEKFDVEKACEEADKDSSENESETEVPPQVEYRLREEASFEKEKGNQYVKSQKWDDAISCYTRAIKCYPYDAIFYANRALCFLKLKDFRATEADCTSALQLDNTYVKAYQRRAAARVELHQLEEAVADLCRVLELEPKNTASRLELAKLQKTQLKQKVVKPSSQKPISKSAVDAIPGPSGLSEIKIGVPKQAKCSANQGIVNKNKSEVLITDKPDSQAIIVLPIQKPPHLHSKKPLRRIKIEEFDSSSSNVVESRSEIAANKSPVQQSPESQMQKNTKTSSSDGQLLSSVDMSGQELESEKHFSADEAVETASQDWQTQVPPAPVSSVQFFVGWSKVKGNSKLKYLYLKQISGADLPKLFQDSLESNILSTILSTLVNEFVKEGSLVYPYLLGLSKVRRFSALSFFLSKEEKECVRKLLDHCVRHGECTENEATLLKAKYEL